MHKAVALQAAAVSSFSPAQRKSSLLVPRVSVCPHLPSPVTAPPARTCSFHRQPAPVCLFPGRRLHYCPLLSGAGERRSHRVEQVPFTALDTESAGRTSPARRAQGQGPASEPAGGRGPGRQRRAWLATGSPGSDDSYRRGGAGLEDCPALPQPQPHGP